MTAALSSVKCRTRPAASELLRSDPIWIPPRIAAVIVGIAMTAASRQRTRQLLMANREPAGGRAEIPLRLVDCWADPDPVPVTCTTAGTCPVVSVPCSASVAGDAELPSPAVSPRLVTDRLRTALAPHQQAGPGRTLSLSYKTGKAI